MKVADTGVEGIGFAIPIDDAIPILNASMEKGKISRPYMGVYSMDLGIYLDSVQTGVADDSDNGDGATTAAVRRRRRSGRRLPTTMALQAAMPSFRTSDRRHYRARIGRAVVGRGHQFNDISWRSTIKPINSTIDLRKYLYNTKKIGESLKVTYYRDGKKATVDVELAEKTKEPEPDER